ncbi:MAG: hypothetical protein ACUVRL_08105 [Candidatus Saccharicenans sp.]|uniref:hypothetical protein n=1 Tax=Candidatus Saccharicenans sp. TaxID=2819258 RepID=UPI0040499F1D
MNLTNYLKLGFNRAVFRFRLAVYLWLTLLFLAFLAMAPVNFLLRQQLGHLYLPDNPLMPLEFSLLEVFLANQTLLAPYARFLLAFILISAVIFVFLSAGLFGRMLSPDPVITFRELLSDGCRYFWKFLLSLLVFLPFLVLMFLLFRLLAMPLNLWSAQAVTEWPVLIASNLRMLVMILLWTAFKLLLDLVRIIMVTESRKVIPAYASALRFLRSNFFRLWGLYMLLGVGVILISVLWLLIARLFTTGTLVGLLLIIILGQVHILFRLLARQVFIGVEYSYYTSRKGD